MDITSRGDSRECGRTGHEYMLFGQSRIVYIGVPHFHWTNFHYGLIPKVM
jgi:hypothetical protein